MLTVMCPNCRHRFPAPGCCSGAAAPNGSNASNGFTNGLNAGVNFDCLPTSASGGLLLVDAANLSDKQQHHHQVTISTQCGIQSGGRLIQSSNAEVLLAATTGSPHLELRSKLSGGGCLVQKRMDEIGLDDDGNDVLISAGQEEQTRPLLISEEQLRSSFEQAAQFQRSHSTTARLGTPTPPPAPPSGCQELPGMRRENSEARRSCTCCCNCRCCQSYCRSSNEPRSRNLCQVAACTSDQRCKDAPADLRIQVNATVRLPATSSCTLNITASTSTSSNCTATTNSPLVAPNAGSVGAESVNRFRNNFNGGGIVTVEQQNNGTSREEAPGTPVSWLMPCPWGFEGGYMPDKDVSKLAEVRRLLQGCGWYHEGLSWQQSENILKDAPVGRWLMRESSDSRYTFAISVQTARGPTSVRVFYCMGKFRLDAEPRLALAMPLFDCPIKMLEYYREYSKRMDEHRQEVWVDYSGQVYSQIYLSEPLVREVRSLSHLARIAVNKAGAKLDKDRDKLPPLIRNYLKEYPYTL